MLPLSPAAGCLLQPLSSVCQFPQSPLTHGNSIGQTPKLEGIKQLTQKAFEANAVTTGLLKLSCFPV